MPNDEVVARADAPKTIPKVGTQSHFQPLFRVELLPDKPGKQSDAGGFDGLYSIWKGWR